MSRQLELDINRPSWGETISKSDGLDLLKVRNKERPTGDRKMAGYTDKDVQHSTAARTNTQLRQDS